MLNQKQIGRLGFALIPLAGILGCPHVFPVVTDIPPELEYVMQNKAAFAQDPEDPLADVVGGEVRDELSGLDGCWGAFNERPVDLTPPSDSDTPAVIVDAVVNALPDSLSVADYRVFVFDNANEAMRAMALTQDVQQPGGFTTMVTHTGPFTVADNLVTLKVLVSAFDDPRTGNIITYREADYGVDHELAWFVTVDGDRLRVRASPEEDWEISDGYVFHRFECPADGG